MDKRKQLETLLDDKFYDDDDKFKFVESNGLVEITECTYNMYKNSGGDYIGNDKDDTGSEILEIILDNASAKDIDDMILQLQEDAL